MEIESQTRYTLIRSQIYLLVIYIILSPFYFFESGYPQLADIFIVILFISIPFCTNRVKNKEALQFGFIFIFYVVLIQGLLVIYLQDIMLTFIMMFWIYNFALFYSVQAVYFNAKQYMIQTLKRSVEISAVLQVLLYIITAWPNYEVGRQTIFFNNPNQLGYYALVMASIYDLILSRYPFKRKVLSYLTFGCLTFLVILSLSKAAIVSFAFLISLKFYDKPKNVLLTFLVLLALFFAFSKTGYYESLKWRIELIGHDSDDNYKSRGYDRIISNPEYLIFGAGEGGMKRFDTEFKGEIHSTFGTVLFSYGFIGFLLFMIFIYNIYRYSDIRSFVYLIPVAMYGVTHNGLRFSPVWILLSLVLAVPSLEKKKKL